MGLFDLLFGSQESHEYTVTPAQETYPGPAPRHTRNRKPPAPPPKPPRRMVGVRHTAKYGVEDANALPGSVKHLDDNGY